MFGIYKIFMLKSKLSKNGMITLPAEIKKTLNIKPGDEVSFIKTDEGYIIVPLVDIFDLVNPNEMEKAKEIIQELRNERKKEKW